jgi:alpha-N-arabinofuranosidase
MFRHSDVVAMAAYTAFISQLSFDGAESTYSPTGLVFRLYRQRFGTIPIEVTGNAPQRPVKGTVGVDLPSISSGGDTWPLDVVAALDGGRTALTVAIVNPTETAQSIRVAFDNVDPQGRGTKWEVAADDLQAWNVAGAEPEVTLEEHPLAEVPGTLTVAPLSVSLYRFEVR